MTDKSYTYWLAMSDDALTKHIGNFVKHHRLKQNRTQNNLANEAGISRSTLSLLERGEPVTLPTLIRVLRVLDLLYVMEVFNVQTSISPLTLAKLEQAKRQRARDKKD
jgi:transcriptional regulator with XRE-family HTH domain